MQTDLNSVGTKFDFGDVKRYDLNALIIVQILLLLRRYNILH